MNRGGLADDPTPTFDRIADVRAVHAIYVAAEDTRRRTVSAGAGPDGPRPEG